MAGGILMKRSMSGILIPLIYASAVVLLLLFSYTQVDLSLTLSRLSIYQTIEKSFQHIGYYQRPLATAMFLGLVALFFGMYEWALLAVRRGSLTIHGIRKIIIGMAVVLIFSYPAFSYDIFNYMFDAKTVVIYHKLPYSVTPLQFTGVEPWLSFMHWTHIPSNYMPLWIALSVPAYLTGFGYFLGILWSFKALMAAAYLVCAWFIWKILSRLEPRHATLGVAIFALNPLVIFETLVSGHNDMVMMAFAIAAFYAYLTKHRLASFVLLSFSAGTKIMTGVLVPLFVIGWQRKWSLVATAVGFILFIAVTGREVLPWYLLWFLPWIALLPRVNWIRVTGTILSAGLLLSYAPFLYNGDYQPSTQTAKLAVNLVMLSLVGLWILVGIIRSRRHVLHLP